MLGAGTQTNPYLISTPEDLNAIRNNLSAYYELTNDIDMSIFGNFLPINKSTPQFTGAIDGKGYKIINLSIVDNSEYTAFIGRTNGGSIKNLGFENIYVESNSHHLAGLIGLNYMTTISNCYVTGTIKNTGGTTYYTGGLIGRSYGLIENCFTQCNVIGRSYVGGFIAYFSDNKSVVNNNYSSSTVSGTSNVGGFYGYSNPNAGYQPTFKNNFFDKDVVGITNYQTTGVTAKITSEMQTQSTYTGWDFDNVWYMESYPALRVFANIPTAKKETITVSSFSLPFFTKLGKGQKSTKQLQSFTDTIQTNSERYTATLRSVSAYLSQIETNVTQSHRSVRTGDRNVSSFINPIGSFVHRESKTVKNLISHIKPLESHVSVLHPLRDIPIHAYSEVIQNPSSVSEVANYSDVRMIQNLSEVEVN